jgi:hypothetical protein
MSKAREEIEVLPPKFDDDSNPIVIEEGSKSGTSNTPSLENLIKKLDKLKAKNKRLKAKSKKGTKYSSSSEDGDSSFDYNNMPNSTSYTSVPNGKAPYFDGSNYNQWKHCMKNYLYSLHPEV